MTGFESNLLYDRCRKPSRLLATGRVKGDCPVVSLKRATPSGKEEEVHKNSQNHRNVVEYNTECYAVFQVYLFRKSPIYLK